MRLFASLLAVLSAAVAQAQPVATAWDRSDPTNKAELRIFLATAYQFEQAGQTWPDADLFWFTNTPPDDRLVMLAPAFDVFNELYQHRLDPWGAAGAPYSLVDLMRDDPAVAAKFKNYTLNGEFITGTDDDPAVLAKHLAMVIEAITASEEYKLDNFMMLGEAFKSVNLVKQPAVTPPATAPTMPTPVAIPPGLEQFHCDLQAWVKRSLLACMKSKGLYKGENDRTPTNPNPRGRFDCDDFSNAMAQWLLKWLKQQYPNMDVKIFGFYWKCPKLDANGQPVLDPSGQPVYIDQGHAMTIVIIDGLYFLIDPYTGQTHGPYSTLKDANDAAIAIAHQSGMLCQGWKPGSPPATWPPGQHPSPLEPKPWWDWEDMQRRFCEKLQQCCNEIPTWYTPPTNCTPTTLPDGSTPSAPTSPCDKIRPYMPPGPPAKHINNTIPCYSAP
jgi:hypothetical protein